MEKIILKLTPSEGKRGIPIHIVQKKLLSLQNSLWAMGEYHLYKELKPGRKSPYIFQNYNLEITETQTGSLIFVIQPSAEAESMFPEEGVEKQINDLLSVINNIENKEKVFTLLPDATLRKKVLHNLKELSPSGEVNSIEINEIPISPTFKSNIDEILKPHTITEEEKEETGIIVEVKLFPKFQFGILITKEGKPEIKKFTPPYEFSDVIISSISNVVIIKYKASIDLETKEESVGEIIDITPVEGNFFEISNIEYNNIRFILSEPLQIKISFEENLWILTNEKLDIYAFGEDFSEAWENFQEDFYIVWQEIAQEEDSKLESKAKKLKQEMIELVGNTEKINA